MSNTEQHNRKEIILITGATSGLGRATAKKCIDLGYTVVITGRSQANLDKAKRIILKNSPKYKSHLYEVILDLADLASVKKGVESFEELKLPCIDIIIHNAGMSATEYEQISGVERTVFINSIAPVFLNQLLLPYIEKSQHPKKRILIVSSGLHDAAIKGLASSPADQLPVNGVTVQDLVGKTETWTPMKYYRISKLANVWTAHSLASRYDIPVVPFCPGFVPTTDLGRNANFFLKIVKDYIMPLFSFTVSENEATNKYIYYMTSVNVKTATFYQYGKPIKTAKDALDKEKQEIWWKFANETIDRIIS